MLDCTFSFGSDDVVWFRSSLIVQYCREEGCVPKLICFGGSCTKAEAGRHGEKDKLVKTAIASSPTGQLWLQSWFFYL